MSALRPLPHDVAAHPQLNYEIWENICLCLVRTRRRIVGPAVWRLRDDDPGSTDDDIASYEPLYQLALINREFAHLVRRFIFETLRCHGTDDAQGLLKLLRDPRLDFVVRKPLFGRRMVLAVEDIGELDPALGIMSLAKRATSLAIRTPPRDLLVGGGPIIPLKCPAAFVDAIRSCANLVQLQLTSAILAPTIVQLLALSKCLPRLTHLDVAALVPDHPSNLTRFLLNNDGQVWFPLVTNLAIGIQWGLPMGGGGQLVEMGTLLMILRRRRHLPLMRFLDIRGKVGGWVSFLGQRGFQLEHLGIGGETNLSEAVLLDRYTRNITRLRVSTTDTFTGEYTFEHHNLREIIIEDGGMGDRERNGRTLMDFVTWALTAYVPGLVLVVVRSKFLPHQRVLRSFERTSAVQRRRAFLWGGYALCPTPEIRWECEFHAATWIWASLTYLSSVVVMTSVEDRKPSRRLCYNRCKYVIDFFTEPSLPFLMRGGSPVMIEVVNG